MSSDKELFVSMLTEDQKNELEREGAFTVTGSLGHQYRILTERPPEHWSNVQWWDEYGQCPRFLGSYYYDYRTSSYYPAWDQFLAQKLLIETDEIKFVSICCGVKPAWYYTHRARYG